MQEQSEATDVTALPTSGVDARALGPHIRMLNPGSGDHAKFQRDAVYGRSSPPGRHAYSSTALESLGLDWDASDSDPRAHVSYLREAPSGEADASVLSWDAGDGASDVDYLSLIDGFTSRSNKANDDGDDDDDDDYMSIANTSTYDIHMSRESDA